MARPRKAPGHRLLQAKLPTAMYDRLLSLKDRTDAPNNAEVLGRALRLYEACIDEMGQDATIWIEGADGTKIKAFLT